MAYQGGGNMVDLGGMQDAGRDGLMQAGAAFSGQVQKGGAGVSMLAFCGGAALVVIGVWGLLGGQGLVEYVIDVYQIGFGIVMCLLEMQSKWFQDYPKLSAYYTKVAEHAKFLTLLIGRGFFYLFLGSLTCSVAWTSPLDIPQMLVGFYILLIGILCIGMHFNPEVTQQYVAGATGR
jgi:hypothetical protein